MTLRCDTRVVDVFPRPWWPFSQACLPKSTVFSFHEIQLTRFLPFPLALSGSWKALPTPSCDDLVSVFCTLSISFPSVSHLGVSFCTWCEANVEILFFNFSSNVQMLKNHLLKDILSLLHCFDSFVGSQLTQVWV